MKWSKSRDQRDCHCYTTEKANVGMEKVVSKTRKKKTKNDISVGGGAKEALLENRKNDSERQTDAKQKNNETKVKQNKVSLVSHAK